MKRYLAVAALLFPLTAAAQNAPFCVVQSHGTQCFYFNANMCQQQARASGGMCVQNPNNQQQAQQQNAQSNFMDTYQRSYAFGAQMRQQREAHAAELRAKEAEAAMYEAQARQAQEVPAYQPTAAIGPTVEYICENADGFRWETRVPTVGCVVVAVEP
jgi:hypothetical protein